MEPPESGDEILLNGTPAEVIKTYSIGDLDYLRAYIKDVGVKTVCIDDVDIEAKQDSVSALDPVTANQLHPDHEAVSADWFRSPVTSPPTTDRSRTGPITQHFEFTGPARTLPIGLR